jgi:hypothetical protein
MELSKKIGAPTDTQDAKTVYGAIKLAVNNLRDTAVKNNTDKIQQEVTARTAADLAINEKIGDGFSAQATVAQALEKEQNDRLQADENLLQTIGTNADTGTTNTVYGAIAKAKADALTTLTQARNELQRQISDLAINQIGLPDHLTFTEPFGIYGNSDEETKNDLSSTGQYTIDIPGDWTLQTLLENAFAADKTPTTTQPSISIACTNGLLKSYEVGTTDIDIDYKITTNEGKYSFDDSTGVSWTEYTVSLGTINSTGQLSEHTDDITGTLSISQVTDGMNLTLSASMKHTEGDVPHTAKGNSYENGQIKEATKTATGGSLKGYRNMFAGTMTSKPSTMTSDNIRALGQTKEAKATTNWSVEIPNGAQRVIIAIPSDRTLVKVLDSNDSNANIVNSFAQTNIDVSGANGYTAISYKVYYMDAAKSLQKNTYIIDIS